MSDISPINLKKQDKVVMATMAILAAIVGAGVIYGLGLIMPFLVALAENTIYFALEMLALVIIVLSAAQVWAERDLFYYKWKNIARNIRKAIIREDPVGVLKTAISRFDQKIESIDEKIAEAIGALKIQVAKQKEAQAKADTERNNFLAAERMEKSDSEKGRYAVAATRWEKAAQEMQPMVDLLTNMKSSLQKARDLANNTLEDLKNQLEVLSVRLEASQAGKSAASSLKAFFSSSNESDMAMMAFEEIEKQTAEAEASIEEFMRVMDPSLRKADLQAQAEAIAAMERFSERRIQKALNPAPEVEVVSVTKVAQKETVKR